MLMSRRASGKVWPSKSNKNQKRKNKCGRKRCQRKGRKTVVVFASLPVPTGEHFRGGGEKSDRQTDRQTGTETGIKITFHISNNIFAFHFSPDALFFPSVTLPPMIHANPSASASLLVFSFFFFRGGVVIASTRGARCYTGGGWG